MFKNKKVIVGFCVLLLVGAAAYFFVPKKLKLQAPKPKTVVPQVNAKKPVAPIVPTPAAPTTQTSAATTTQTPAAPVSSAAKTPATPVVPS